jgi:hypothetical protein
MNKNNVKVKIYTIMIVVLVGVALTMIPSCKKTSHEGHEGHAVETKSDERTVKYWTCPMHPQVKMDQKDICTICKMDLVPKFEDA